jgi:hypothetical protein
MISDFAGLSGLIVGSVLGGLTGYTAYAAYDLSSNASVLGAALGVHPLLTGTADAPGASR